MKQKLEPKCKQCRREGVKLFLKGDRCHTSKCAIVKRNFPPGMHGNKGGNKMTDYGLRLREKQKAKRMYNVNEAQMRGYFARAFKTKENTGSYLKQLLEQRLDNVIFRLQFAKSRSAARQLVSHGFVMVNGRRVDIASYQVCESDIIAIKENKQKKAIFKEWPAKDIMEKIPSWVSLDAEKKQAKILHTPKEEDLQLGLDMNLIIEHYSR